MKSENLNDGEFQLRLEETKRVCIPAQIGEARGVDHKLYPSLLIEKSLPRGKYQDKIVDTQWSLANDHGQVRAVYLEFMFRDIDKFKVCFDDFGSMFIYWLRLMVDTNGHMVLSDTTETSIGGIGVDNVSLDIPLLLIGTIKVKRP